MFKESTALFLYAETSLHAGSGESLGAIDLAIQRERYTGFPCVAAQGIKGPIRDWFERKYKMPENPDPDKLTPEQKQIWAAFGPNTQRASEHAGAVAFTDARILLFPVRSMKGVFAWITCPFILGRLKRDLALAQAADPPDWKNIEVPKEDGESYALGAVAEHACKATGDSVLLEEEVFRYRRNDEAGKVAAWLRKYAFPNTVEYAFWQKRLSPNQGESEKPHLLVLHDDDFRHFVRTATEVQARVKLGPKKTTTEDGNLFYQENLPPDTLLYSVILAADSLKSGVNDDAVAMLTFTKELGDYRLQIGGDETTGKGYVYATFLRDDTPADGGSHPEGKTQDVTA